MTAIDTGVDVSEPRESPISGLTEEEVAQRRAHGEINGPPPPTGRTYTAIVRENVLSFINIVLFGLCAALAALGEWSDAAVA